MEFTEFICTLKLTLVFIFVLPIRTVTINSPLCPTNKIAPFRNRRIANWDDPMPRTLGAFYDLFVPNNQYNAPLSSLQEEPQKDDEDDCGDIDDYDENDLSSLTQTQQQRPGYESRLFFGGLFGGPAHGHNQQQHHQQGNRPGSQQSNHPGSHQGNYPGSQQGIYPGSQQGSYPVSQQGNYPGSQQGSYPGQHYQQTGSRPPRPQRPNKPATRPPYSSGGFFDNNHYRPQSDQYPSDEVKPVREGSQDPSSQTYRPDVVGGPIGHVVGVMPVWPTSRPQYDEATRAPQPSYVRYPTRSTTTPAPYPTRRPKPRQLNKNNDSVLGSFIDLLFK